MTRRQKLEELYRSWKEMVQLKEKMGRTILELAAHPDGTIEHIAQALPPYKALVAKLRAHKPVIVKALDSLPILQRAVMDTKL